MADGGLFILVTGVLSVCETDFLSLLHFFETSRFLCSRVPCSAILVSVQSRSLLYQFLLVQVDGAPAMPFCETFILHNNGASWYIHNTMFRLNVS